MLTDEWPASSKFLFCARPGAARCSHRKKTSIAVVPDAATAKLQEMARGSHRESTQQVEKPPIANFRECCRYCKMLQDVAMLHNCKTGSQRVSRPPPLNSPSSILSKTPKLHFSIFFATLQEPVQLQPRLAFTTSRSTKPTLMKNFCSMHTLMPSTPVALDGFIDASVAYNMLMLICRTSNAHVDTRVRRVGTESVATGTLAAVLGPTVT